MAVPVQNQMEQLFEQLGRTLNDLANIRGARSEFKPPRYDGGSNVELFIQQFDDVVEQNEWTDQAALLHLRSCLQDEAVECGAGTTVDEIKTALRARFGCTRKQAKDRLANIKRQPGQTLCTLGSEIERLMRIAYPEMDDNDRGGLAIDFFLRALDNTRLEQHLLNSGAETLAETIVAADEWLQIGNAASHRHRVNVVGTTYEKASTGEPPDERLDKILKAVEDLCVLVKNQTLQNSARRHQNLGEQRASRLPANRQSGKLSCWQCGGNHYKWNCPQLVGANASKQRQSGNASSPHQ